MSRRQTKPQLSRRSGLSLHPPTGSISLCLSRGASCPLLARGVPVPPHSRGPKARAGPTTRGPFCSAQPVAQTSPPARCDGPQLFARHRRPTSQTRKKCRGSKLTAPTPRAPVPPTICVGIRLNHTGLCRFSLSFPLSAPSRSPRVLRRPDSQAGTAEPPDNRPWQ